MPFEFSIKLKRKDLFSFKMYQVRHSFQGFLALVFFLMLLFIVIATFGDIGLLYSMLYLFSAIIVIFYFPLIMFLQAKTEVENLEKYKQPFDFFLSNDGLRIKQLRSERSANSMGSEENSNIPGARSEGSRSTGDSAASDDFVSMKPKIEFVSWDKVYRVKETSRYFFIFTGRDSAFILPKRSCGSDVRGVREFFYGRLPRERVHLAK